MQPFWILRRDAAATHVIGARRVTPVVQAIGLRWPRGGWLWQFPLAVHVEEMATGTTTRVPIRDLTRNTLWFLYALTAIVVLAAALIRRQRRAQRRHAAKISRKGN